MLAAAQNESVPSLTKQNKKHARWLSGNLQSNFFFFFMDCVGPEKDQKIHLINKVLIQALRKDDAQN